MNRECKVCEGAGVYEVVNRRTETIEYNDCIDCMLDAQFKEHLTIEVSKIISQASHEKLAWMLAKLTVNSVDANKNDDLDRVHNYVKSKDLVSLLNLADAYTQA